MSILYRYATTRRGRCHQCNSLLTDKGFDASSWATGTPCELSGQRGSSLQLQLHKGCRDACSCRSQGAGELDSGPARRQTWHCPDRYQACTATCTCGITKGITWSPTSPTRRNPVTRCQGCTWRQFKTAVTDSLDTSQHCCICTQPKTRHTRCRCSGRASCRQHAGKCRWRSSWYPRQSAQTAQGQ